MRRFTVLTILLLLAVALPAAADSEEQWLELFRADLRADKVAILTEAMELNDAQGKEFWPVYREYEGQLAQIGDRRLELIRRYAENYTTLSEDQAKEIASTWFGIMDDRAKLRKKYYKKIERTLKSSIAARFIQVEHQLSLLLDLEIASEMPLIEALN